MSEQTISPLLATAALGVVILAAMFAFLVADSRIGQFARGHAQLPAIVVSLSAMLSSLYYSEIAEFTPCPLCWYQRIAMYPLVFVLAVAIVSRDVLRARYVVVPAAIGLLISVYHYQLQLNPEQSSICSGPTPCTTKWVNELGFVSIPFMAGCGFAAILLIYAAHWRAERKVQQWEATTQQRGQLFENV